MTHATGSTNWTFVATLVEGLNSFSVTAENGLGVESAADTITVSLDTTAPPSIRPVPVTE